MEEGFGFLFSLIFFYFFIFVLACDLGMAARGGSLQAPLVPSARPCPRRNECTPRKMAKEMAKETTTSPTPPPPIP